MSIKGVHAMFYTAAPEEMRAFLRDQLNFPYQDTGDGWLVFDAPEVEIGCHPSDRRFHQISFYCDDIHETIAEFKGRGVEFTQEIVEQEWGWITRFRVPDGQEIELYQPKY